LVLFGTIVAPRKGKTHFVTIESSGSPISLLEIFADLYKKSAESQHMTASVFSFQYWNGNDVTVLVSKNAAKYRIQSNDFESLFLLASDLIYRLQELDKSSTVQFNEPYPLESYFAVIDEHFNSRTQLKDQLTELRNLAQQFRSIQKRLLVRYKDKNPTPLNGLDVLFEQTIKSLNDKGAAVEKGQARVAECASKLANSTNLILALSKLKLTEPEHQVLCSMLCSVVPPFSEEEHGWEEIVESNMVHLLRTVLAKSKSESASIAQPIQMAQDTRKLQKYIALVFDRIAKGGKLVTPEQQSTSTGKDASDGSQKKKRTSATPKK